MGCTWPIKEIYLENKIFFLVILKLLLVSSTGSLTISLETCQEDMPIFSMHLKMGMVTPSD
jgi:hypothetical protein